MLAVLCPYLKDLELNFKFLCSLISNFFSLKIDYFQLWFLCKSDLRRKLSEFLEFNAVKKRLHLYMVPLCVSLETL